ncbi:response regulator transcription factor [Erythrobacter sp.]|uniref:LuxR C-terminal-related transcriptional regulator n=1 Tax=Erythrobacter sp. TaxID=1042 RepID=UPI00261BFBD6|nr:response regulator transcription factor [Erythrobacter sp.]
MSDNALAREGLRRILEGDEFTVVESHASSCALASLEERVGNPEIVILDVGDDEEICAEVEASQRSLPSSKIVVLSNDFNFDLMFEAFKSGVDAYIVKRIDCEALIGSLRLVHLGEKVMPSELAKGFPSRWSGKMAPSMSEREVVSLLSEREIETLRFLILGSPNKVIAGHLDISEATVKVHVKAILRKLGAQNRTQAAIWAVKNGIELKQAELIAANGADDASPDVAPEVVAAS